MLCMVSGSAEVNLAQGLLLGIVSLAELGPTADIQVVSGSALHRSPTQGLLWSSVSRC